MIRIRNLVKDYKVNGATFGAVNGIDLDIPDGEFFTLLGPSGCGKSTLLRCISGLETPTEGEIVVNGDVVYSSARNISVPTSKRRMGMVFQSYAIWPHMTVGGNVAFPLEVQKFGDRPARVARALSMVGLEAYASRMAYRLSGGQQQRVALARAIVADPSILLLDEPLSNLDAALRSQMRMELSRLHRELGLTTVFVTHDQEEALSLSHSIAVMNGGRVVEVASPEELYHNPQSLFSAEFLGAANIVEGRVIGQAEGGLAVEATFGTIHAEGAQARSVTAPRSEIALFVRPESVSIRDGAATGGRNEYAGTVVARGFIGHSVNLVIELADGTSLRCIRTSAERVEIGEAVTVSINPEDVGIARDRERTAPPQASL